MDILLDTHTFIWAAFDSKKLPDHINEIISNPENLIYVSIASLWEIEIKHLKRPNQMPWGASDFTKVLCLSDVNIMPLRYVHLFSLEKVVNQNIHNDPFDHLLLATAIDEQMTFITKDSKNKEYKGAKVISY